jgi:hypothetical protein
MRLVLLVASLTLFSATAGAAAPAAAPQPIGDMPVLNPNADASQSCPPISRFEAMKRGAKLKPELLDELPTADMYKAVYRRIGRCVAPIVVGYGIGATSGVKSGKR